MSETMEELEEICDEVARVIDDARGKLNIMDLQSMTDKMLTSTEYTPAQFHEMFENLYMCDVHQYAKNAVDDSEWAEKEGVPDPDEVILGF